MDCSKVKGAVLEEPAHLYRSEPSVVVSWGVTRGWQMVFGDADAAIARVEEDVRRAQQRAERYPALQAAIDDVRARAVSSRRDVAVEVDAGGILRSLEISDAALTRSGRQVSEEVMALIAAASRDARAETLALTTEIMGEDDPIVKAVAADLEALETGSHAWRTEGRA